MVASSFVLKPLALAALLLSVGSAHAVLTVYTAQASFLAAINAPGTDTYANFSITGSTPSPINRFAGAYAYTASASGSSFYGAGTTANPWLSTNTAADTITFSGLAGDVRGIGGNFFSSNSNGLFTAGSVTLTATDGSGSSTQTIVGSTVSSFLGFVSNGPMTSLTLASVQGASPIWPTADNLTIGVGVGVVPEPQTYALMLAGLGMVGFLARRRRR